MSSPRFLRVDSNAALTKRPVHCLVTILGWGRLSSPDPPLSSASTTGLAASTGSIFWYARPDSHRLMLCLKGRGLDYFVFGHTIWLTVTYRILSPGRIPEPPDRPHGVGIPKGQRRPGARAPKSLASSGAAREDRTLTACLPGRRAHQHHCGGVSFLEPQARIGLASSGWKPEALPLSY